MSCSGGSCNNACTRNSARHLIQSRITTATHQSALGTWTHSECTPGHLAHVVGKLWHFDGRISLLRERSFPRVYLEIILQLGPQYREVNAAGQSLELFPVACIGGATVAPTVIEAPDAHCCVMGIQLSALGAFQLTGTPPGNLLGGTVALEDVCGAETALLVEALSEATCVAARFVIVTRFIERRLEAARQINASIVWATTQLHHDHSGHVASAAAGSDRAAAAFRGTGTASQMSIAEMQQTTGYSKARFVALFREHTGFSPKQYARILRFRRALKMLQHGVALSRTAHECGFYDHAHMCRDFSEYAHMSPKAFVAANRFPSSMSLPETG